MRSSFRSRINRTAVSLTALAAITFGTLGVAASLPGHADAALKWNEQAAASTTHPTPPAMPSHASATDVANSGR